MCGRSLEFDHIVRDFVALYAQGFTLRAKSRTTRRTPYRTGLARLPLDFQRCYVDISQRFTLLVKHAGESSQGSIQSVRRMKGTLHSRNMRKIPFVREFDSPGDALILRKSKRRRQLKILQQTHGDDGMNNTQECQEYELPVIPLVHAKGHYTYLDHGAAVLVPLCRPSTCRRARLYGAGLHCCSCHRYR